MSGKNKIKVKLVSKEEKKKEDSVEALLKSMFPSLQKSGAVGTDNASVQTQLDKSLDRSIGLSSKDYVALCLENDLVPDGSHIEGEAERKEYLDGLTDEQKADVAPKDRILTFRGSDETVDRYGDIVRVKGWDLSNYKKNPVFLVFHDSQQFPAGRTLKVWKEMNDEGAPEGRSLMFNVYFPEGNDWADFVYQQYKDKLLNAVSVGFRPTKVNDPSTMEEREALGLGPYGYEFLKQELMELSAVPLPANQNAVRVKGVGMQDLAKRLNLESVIVKDDGTDEEDEEPVEGIKSMSDKSVEAFTKSVEDFGALIKEFTSAVKGFTEATKSMSVSITVVDEDAVEIDPVKSIEDEAVKSSDTYMALLDNVKNINKSMEDK